jgi:hypothetical protein
VEGLFFEVLIEASAYTCRKTSQAEGFRRVGVKGAITRYLGAA